MTLLSRPTRAHRVLGTLPARDALAVFAERVGGDAIGFCYRPVDARWFRLDADGAAADATGQRMDLTGAFELRAFTATHELRWRNDSAGRGDTLLVHDTDTEPATGPLLRDPYQRLLWGRATEPANHGWLTLFDARVGTLEVPVDGAAGPGSQVWLQAVEYELEDEHGNVSVVDERLTGLVVREGTMEDRR